MFKLLKCHWHSFRRGRRGGAGFYCFPSFHLHQQIFWQTGTSLGVVFVPAYTAG